jgi:hypothetical protein
MLSSLTDLKGLKQSQIAGLVMDHLRTPLYANAYALMANQVASAGLGVLYWMIAARFYSPEVVGENSAIISGLLFLTAMSEFGLKAAMSRFIPRMRARTGQLILITYGVNLAATAVVSLGFFWAAQYSGFARDLLEDANEGSGWLILAAMAWCVFYVQDGALTGMRQSIWVLAKNTLFNIGKILLLLVLANRFGHFGIVASWFLPAPVFILLVNSLIFQWFLPKHIASPATAGLLVTKRLMITSTMGDYVGSILAESSIRLLPLFVLTLLGGQANAYFYQAWTLALPFLFIAWGMTASFTVEAA